MSLRVLDLLSIARDAYDEGREREYDLICAEIAELGVWDFETWPKPDWWEWVTTAGAVPGSSFGAILKHRYQPDTIVLNPEAYEQLRVIYQTKERMLARPQRKQMRTRRR